MYDPVLKLLSSFKVEIDLLMYNMERGIYLPGFKAKLWAKFNVIVTVEVFGFTGRL